jgi:hypothetical protein
MTVKSFLHKKIDENSTLFYYDLNIKTNYTDYILALSSLIIEERNKGNHVKVRPDKRLRASGLHVLFSNKKSYYEMNKSIRQQRKEMFQKWKIKT